MFIIYYHIVKGILFLIDWFYGLWDGFLWQVVKYLGIPIYICGIIAALSFSGGYFIVIIVLMVLYYLYISKLLHNTDPIEPQKQNN